jgi:prepilin-type N-terminal cleavage/methylation domain-containing protein
MLSAPVTKCAAAVRDERGMTLVELLVATAAGLIVMSALFTILDVTLHQTSRTLTRVAATQRARTTFEGISNELHSACIAKDETPIQPSLNQAGNSNGSIASTANSLVFISQYGTATNPTPVEHSITFDPDSGTLKEYTYAVTGSGPLSWQFASTPTPSAGRLLLNNVVQSGSTPVFQYYAYEPYTDVNGNPAMMLMDGSTPVPGTASVPNPDPLSTTPSGLSTDDAKDAAEVVITLKVGADVNANEVGGGLSNGPSSTSGTWITVSDSVVLRFVTTPNQLGSNATFAPCA